MEEDPMGIYGFGLDIIIALKFNNNKIENNLNK